MDFLRAHEDFEEVPLAPVFAEQGITLPRLENMATQLMLHPALLDSDGYFMARLKKKS
jgi:16S rRNA C967 or C1407 C5-methylase (RsmB/RsmF family)